MAIDDEREIDFLRAAESSFRFCMDRVNETYNEELMPERALGQRGEDSERSL